MDKLIAFKTFEYSDDSNAVDASFRVYENQDKISIYWNVGFDVSDAVEIINHFQSDDHKKDALNHLYHSSGVAQKAFELKDVTGLTFRF